MLGNLRIPNTLESRNNTHILGIQQRIADRIADDNLSFLLGALIQEPARTFINGIFIHFIKKLADRNLQNLTDIPQTAAADTITAGFIFLNLLKGQP